ncbi:hypothetical protein BC332_04039 [Capsicum chinense]|nr:hypothetical protein BC332_04039 [Capsicum chinense]
MEFENYYPVEAFFLEHELDFEKRSRAHFPSNRYNVMTTNIVESINAILIDERITPWHPYSIQFLRGLVRNSRRGVDVLNYKNNNFVLAAEKIARDNMSEGNSFYMVNINKDGNQFTMFGRGPTTKVNLLKKTCSCGKYDLVKISCAYPMVALQLKYRDDYGLSFYE